MLRSSRNISRLVVFLSIALSILIPVQSNAVVALPLALLNPAVVGSVVVAGGLLAGAAAHYAPAVYEAGQVAVDSLGKFNRTLYQAQKFALQSGAQYIVGRLESAAISVGQSGSAVYDWITSHSADTPLINSAINSSSSSGTVPIEIGSIFTIGAGNQQITILGDPVSVIYEGYYGSQSLTDYMITSGYTPFAGGFIRGGLIVYDITDYGYDTPPYSHFSYTYRYITSVATNESPTLPAPAGFSPLAFQSAINSSPPADIADEVDKIIAANPSSVTAPPWAETDTRNAIAIAQAAAAQDAADKAQALADANPTDPALQAAADAAKALAEQKEIEQQLPIQDLPATPALPTAPGLPAIPTVPTLDFAGPIKTALDGTVTALQTHEPFATFAALPDLLDNLTATPQAPVFDVTLPYVGEFHVDLAPWDGVATMVRAGLSLLALVGLSFFVIKVWV